MRDIGVAIDAGDAALLEHRVGFLPILTLRIDRVGIMATAAGDTVPPAQPGLGFLGELYPVSRPDLWILEIVREFGNRVSYARGGLHIGLEEPVRSGNVTVAATGKDALVVAPVRRLLEVLIVSLNAHRVTGCAECIGPCGMINHRARNDGSRADCRSDKQQNCEDPPFDLHLHC